MILSFISTVRGVVSKIKINKAVITNPLTNPMSAPRALSAIGSNSGSSS